MNSVPSCRACRASLGAPLIDLGHQPLANSYVMPGDEHLENHHALVVRMCATCLLVQTDHSVMSEDIFTPDYAYFSSYSSDWVEHARRYCDAMIARFALSPKSRVIEVASNDGYLLQHFLAKSIPVLGIEPTSGTATAAIEKGIPTEIAFFGRELAERLRQTGGPADLIAANNVLAHVPDVRDFTDGFAALLADEGVITFEFPHLLQLVNNVQFDTIYHEHYSYLSLAALERVLAASELRTFDVEKLPTHGGSLRLFVCHRDATFVRTNELESVLEEERAVGLDQPDGSAFNDLVRKIETARSSFRDFVANTASAGKSVAAYGAAAKGNTFLNYCGVTHREITCVADLSVAKQGRLLPGSHIPIVSPEELRRRRPDFIVILPWNLATEITASLADMTASGTKLVIAIPQTRVLP